MNKLARVIVAIGMLGGTSTVAIAEPVTFSGTMIVEATSSACGILPYIEQGTLFNFSLRPGGLGTNGASTTANLRKRGDVVLEDIQVSFKLPTGGLNKNFQSVSARQLSVDPDLALAFETFVAKMRILQQFPGTLSASTPFVTARLQISKFGNVPKCVVTLWSAAALDPSTPKIGR